MGMRCSQPQGLPVEALEFLDKNAVKLNQCLHCYRHDGYKKKIIGHYGMFDELPLHRYTLLNGETIEEYVQETMWSSGPIIWLALKWKDGATFMWAERIINAMTNNH